MNCIYENKINGYGALVDAFLNDGIIILFGENAPDTLKDYCYTIEVKKADDNIVVGQTLVIGDNEYKITAVGDVAQKNLEALGHLTVAFSGEDHAAMPGTIVVEKSVIPTIEKGSLIKILA